MGFADSLKKNIQNSLQHINDNIIQTAIEFGNKLVDYSPAKPDARYAVGVFINSWYPAVNEFDPTIGAAPDMSGSGSRQRINSLKDSKAFLGQDGYISFSNNLDYSMLVEVYGWQVTGPYAPIRNSITAILGAKKQ